MKKLFLLPTILLIGHLGMSAQGEYLVKTKPAASNAPATSSLSPEAAFVNNNFKHYSLCDWYPGMRFMVIPEELDLIIPTFRSAATGKEVESGELKHRIMEYQGVETTERGHLHFSFLSDTTRFFVEVKHTTLNNYCSDPQNGIPTLAYLGDVDIANALLVGETLYIRCENVCQDDINSPEGFRTLKIARNTPVKVTAVGVGSRAFPVKIVFEDANGNSYYKEVAISKTNCGMTEAEFVMEKADRTFAASFGFTDPNLSRKEQLLSLYRNKMVYLKHAGPMADNKGKSCDMRRYTQYTIRDIELTNGNDYVTLTLSDAQNRLFKKQVTFLRKSVIGDVHQSENFFEEVFGMGNLRDLYPTISEATWKNIENGQVSVGMTAAECRLALGEPIRIYKDTVSGLYDWIYENQTILSFKNGKLFKIK